MANDSQWIRTAITGARRHSPDAPDAVWTQVEALLRGKFSERQLPAGELTMIARGLIADMVPPQPDVKGPQ